MASDKTIAVVDRVERERGFVKAVDAYGVDYFIYFNALGTMARWGFVDLRIGSRVRGIAIDHPRGARLIEVDILEL